MSDQYSASPNDITNGFREAAGAAHYFNVVSDGGALPNENSQAARDANDTAFAAAISFGGRILVPKGDYYTGKAIELIRTVWIQGDGGSIRTTGGKGRTNIRPPLGVCGFIVHRPDTSPDGGRGDGSVIEGVAVIPAATTPTWTTGTKTLGTVVCATTSKLDKRGVVYVCTTAGSSSGLEPNWNATAAATTSDGSVTWTARRASGFMFFARATLLDCATLYSGTHGAEEYGNSAGPEGNTNVNGWSIHGFVAVASRGDGVFVDGSDANAGHGANLDIEDCERYGIYDSSFLGNTWSAVQVAGSGSAWFKADDVNACIVLLNAYAESGQPAGSLPNNARVVVVGGLHPPGWDSGSVPLEYGNGRMTPFSIVCGTTLQVNARFGDHTNPLLGIFDAGVDPNTPGSTGSQLQWRYTGWWDWAESGADSRAPIKIAGDTAITGVSPGTPWINRPLLLGAGESVGKRAHIFASAVIPSDPSAPIETYSTGSIAFNIGTDNTIIAWKCTAGGTPGTWTPLVAG